MTDYTFTPADHAAVSSAARQLASRYRGYASYEDIQQECYLWLLTHYDRADKWRNTYSEKHAERTLTKALRNAGERYCRKERAEASGGSVEEEFFYSIPMIADLLTLALDPEWMDVRGIDYSEPKVRVGTPEEGGNLVVMVADVGRAYNGLPEADRALLSRVYGPGEDPTLAIAQLSIEWDCSQSAAYNRIRRVVGRVRAALGGPSPWRDDAEF